MTKREYYKMRIYCNLALIAMAVISGLSFVAQKLGMLYIGPFTFNTLRCFIGCICLIPSAFIMKSLEPRRKNRHNIKNLLKGGFWAGVVIFIAFTINQYCMIYAPAGKAGFITSLYILFVPILAVFMKHKLHNNVKISIIIAIIGLYLLCFEGSARYELEDLFLLISAFFFALHIMVVNKYTKNTNVIKLSCLQFLVAGMLSLPFTLFFEHPEITSILAGWKPVLFIGIIVTGVGYTLQIFGQKATKPVVAAFILSSEAVFAVLGGMLLLGETLSIREIAGCIMMFTAIILAQSPYKLKKKISYKINPQYQ